MPSPDFDDTNVTVGAGLTKRKSCGSRFVVMIGDACPSIAFSSIGSPAVLVPFGPLFNGIDAAVEFDDPCNSLGDPGAGSGDTWHSGFRPLVPTLLIIEGILSNDENDNKKK
jgi:hypothetical protein